ncbi:MAG: 50S ribosomal protein L13 [Sedimentisphaerales bacterium]|nr:50S ribosomal protein L13 [Sedimentisphaerales bacterium]
MNNQNYRGEWFLVDADSQILGRLAVRIAMVLMGKHKPQYTAHVDTGDFVVVTNAEKIKLTGKKAQVKEYDYYTYYMGGRKVIPFEKMFAEKPEKVLTEAVRRMLPKSKMGRHMLSKLKVYRGGEHPHAAQMPRPLEIN